MPMPDAVRVLVLLLHFRHCRRIMASCGTDRELAACSVRAASTDVERSGMEPVSSLAPGGWHLNEDMGAFR